jgi:hypothetical protein
VRLVKDAFPVRPGLSRPDGLVRVIASPPRPARLLATHPPKQVVFFHWGLFLFFIVIKYQTNILKEKI